MRISNEERERLCTDANDGDLEALTTWARSALRHSDTDDIEAIVALLEARWKHERWPELAAAIEHLSPALESPDATLLRTSEAKKISDDDWDRVLDYDNRHDLGALVQTARRGSMASIRKRVNVFSRFEPDPRITRGLARWLLDLPFRATSSRPVWSQIFGLIERAADSDVVEMLEPTVADDWVWPSGATMQKWLSEEVPALVERLRAGASEIARPDAAAAVALAELGSLAGTEEIEPMGDTEGEALSQARAGFEDALNALPDLSGWTDALHHLQTLADVADVDALVDRLDAMPRAPGVVYAPPPGWFEGLELPEHRAHPALRICTSVDLSDIPSKISQPKVAKILARPELQAIRHVHLRSRNLHKRTAAAVLALPRLESLTIDQIATNKALADLVTYPALSARLSRLHIEPEWNSARFDPDGVSLAKAAADGAFVALEELVLAANEGQLRALVGCEMPRLRRFELSPRTEDVDTLLDFVRGRDTLKELWIRPHWKSEKIDVRALAGLGDDDMPRLQTFRFDSVESTHASGVRAFAARHGATLRRTYAHSPCAELIEALGEMPNLVDLEIDYCEGPGAAALESLAPQWPDLSRLAFTNIARTREVVGTLLSSASLPALTTVQIDGSGGRDASHLGRIIAELERPLTHLVARFGDDAHADLAALAASKHRSSLRVFDLGWSSLGAKELDALLDVTWPALQRLEMSNTSFTHAMVDRLLVSPLGERARSGALTISTTYSRFPKDRLPQVLSELQIERAR